MKFDSTNNFGIFLLRHGKTALNTDGHSPDLIRGWKDVPLDQTGLREAKLVAEMLSRSGLKFGKIYASDLKRSVATAKAVAKKYGMKVHPERALRPWHLADLEGTEASDAGIVIRYGINHPDEPVANGESFHDFAKRYLNFFQRIIEEYERTGKNILVVCHYRNLKLAQSWLETGRHGIDEQVFFRDDSPPSSIMRIYQNAAGYGWQIVSHGPREFVLRTSVADQSIDMSTVDRSDPEGLYQKSIDPSTLAAFRAYVEQHGGEVSDGELVQALENVTPQENEPSLGGLVIKLNAMGYRYLYDPVSGQSYEGDQPDLYEEVQDGPQSEIKSNFEESKHPRGQPENSGQFGQGGGSKKQDGGAAGSGGQEANKPDKGAERSDSGQQPASDRGNRPDSGSDAGAGNSAGLSPEHAEANQILQSMFPEGGIDVSNASALAGNPEGVDLAIGPVPGGKGITIDGANDNVKVSRTLLMTPEGPVMHNETYYLAKELRGQGTGTDTFARQVSELQKNGVLRIETLALRERFPKPDQEEDTTGYHVWPKLGYDGPLPKEYLDTLPPQLAGATTIQELYQKPGGQEWWQQNGDSIKLSFDLSPKSASIERLNSYLTAHGKPAIQAPEGAVQRSAPEASSRLNDRLSRMTANLRAGSQQQAEPETPEAEPEAKAEPQEQGKPARKQAGWNLVPGVQKIKKDKDFSYNGEYHVTLDDGNTYAIFHDKNSGFYYAADPKKGRTSHTSEARLQGMLSSQKDEVLKKLIAEKDNLVPRKPEEKPQRGGKSIVEDAWGVVLQEIAGERWSAIFDNAKLHRSTDGLSWAESINDALRYEFGADAKSYQQEVGICFMELSAVLRAQQQSEWDS